MKDKEEKAKKNFAVWLETYMQTNKLQAKDISKATGMHPNVISNWRRGRSVPKGYSLAVLASALAYLTQQPRAKILDNMATALLWD